MTNVSLPEDYTPCVIVLAETGVRYHVQCGGTTCLQNSVEGFLVPLDYCDVAPLEEATLDFDSGENLLRFWRKNPEIKQRLDDALLAMRDGDVKDMEMSLDMSRISDAAESWLPVTTKYGLGWLTWPNSD